MPKKVIKGKVVSDKADKTVVVSVEFKKKHPLYHKIVNLSKKYKAHDEKNEANTGDMVIIEESRPYSKTKTWVLKEVVAKAI